MVLFAGMGKEVLSDRIFLLSKTAFCVPSEHFRLFS